MCGTVQAQGLIWSLPEDGQWVRYEGTYTQVAKQAESGETNLNLNWQRKITLKSVGKETADFRGESVPARWIEIKIETGNVVDNALQTGPGGVQLYKLLIPESVIRGELFDKSIEERPVFIGGIPIIKGNRKSGDLDAISLEGGLFQIYPIVALINHDRDNVVGDETEQVTVPAGTFPSTLIQGEKVTETTGRRSTNIYEVTRSADIPFGVVKWTATTTTEEKGSTDVRSEYKETITIKEEMQAVETGSGAESELGN
ncbi:MAG TPA: hypothetical protein VNQ76_00690 [Planctomicrobium sp.]|nr:hypothetical protein [Planctomicrobium sp.]